MFITMFPRIGETSSLDGPDIAGRAPNARAVLGFGPVAEVEHDAFLLGLELFVAGDGGESAEQEIADVAENGSAPRGDAVLGKELQEIGEDLAKVRDGLEW